MTTGEKFELLVEVMAQLRSERGCIWDRQQTHASLRQYLLEEAYEVLEAIDHEDYGELGKELGDLLLQVVFHAQIAKEEQRFDIAKVIENISAKMIRRHPHVFGDEKVDSVAEQKVRWEELKKQEGKEFAVDGVPKALPALQRAARLQQKANAPTMSWQHFVSALSKIKGTRDGNQHDGEENKHEALRRAYGDALFALVSFGRGLELNAEDALREACERYAQYARTQQSRDESK